MAGRCSVLHREQQISLCVQPKNPFSFSASTSTSTFSPSRNAQRRVSTIRASATNLYFRFSRTMSKSSSIRIKPAT